MKNLVLLSGGLDSALAWHLARRQGETTGLFFDYGQRHMEHERSAMRAFASRHGIPWTEIALRNLQKSDDVVFVGRNLLMVASAIPHAASLGATGIWIGCNWSDRERFPDCRPEFLRALDVCANAYGISLFAPLQGKTKLQVVADLRALGEDTDSLWSCYSPKDGHPCGECLACRTRSP